MAFDALGMVAATAVMGKPEERFGDSLDGFDPDPDDETVAAYLADPLADPHRLLGAATTRLVYDLFAFQRTGATPEPQPAVVATMARETHVADLAAGELEPGAARLRLLRRFRSRDPAKAPAEPGPLVTRRPGRSTALGRQRLDGLQQQGQAGAPVRAVLHRHARVRVRPHRRA